MPAGKSQATLGMGRQRLWTCDHYQNESSDANHACTDSSGESISHGQIFKGSLDYKLGVKDSWGPFPGAEIEWHLEAPTNPASMEFSLYLAMPAGKTFGHKMGAGWGIGAWADNSFFMEYAASKSMGRPTFFGNVRATYLATQIGQVLGDDFSKPLPSNQILVLQAGFGLSYRLPNWIIIPDFIIPQFNVTLPQVPSGERMFRREDIPLAQWDLNFGFGWSY